jgi:hypothetical protein
VPQPAVEEHIRHQLPHHAVVPDVSGHQSYDVEWAKSGQFLEDKNGGVEDD